MEKIFKQINVNTSNEGYVVRHEIHQNRNFIIVPVTMMVGGVHSGSHGPLFHPIDELGRFPAAWDGIPVTIDHPTDNEGSNISANSPQVIDTRTVGRVYNTYVEGNRLRAEAWLDEAKLSLISPEALERIQQNKMIEVSVGVFSEEDPTEGTWNNETYSAIARNHRPDHLALLPEGIGACSVNDGCGIRNNKQIKKGEKNVKSEKSEDLQALKDQAVERLLQANVDQGYRNLVDLARQCVDRLDNEMSVNYLEDVYDDYVIYRRNSRMGSGGSEKYIKQNYSLNNGEFTLTGEPQQVNKQVTYTPVTMQRTKFNNNKEESKMNTNSKEDCGHCMEKVIALINHKQTKFTAADREWLLTQDEATLDKLFPVETAPAVHSEAPKVTSEQILQALSSEDKAALAFGKRQLAERKAAMVKSIQDNTSKETWPDEVLNNMEDTMLERIYNSVKKEEAVVDYSLSTFSQRKVVDTHRSTEEPLYPAGIEIETK